MNRRTEKTVKQGEPELTTSKKLDQIKTGAKIKRQTGGTEKKETIVAGKNGAKTVVHETEEKFEETAVLRKKRNYVMYESKLGTEKNTEITQIAAPKPAPKPKPKPVREPSPRVEEKIVVTKKKREYLDNYQYHETKNIKSKNPRYQVTVEHKRLGDIIGGTFEETSYQRQIFAQGSSRPQIVEQTTTQTATGSAMPKLKANKSESRLVTKTKVEQTSGPQTTESTTTKKRTTTTTTTTTKTEAQKPAVTAKAEKITETTMKRRNEGTGSTTTTRTEKTTTTGGAGSTTTRTEKTTTTGGAGSSTTTRTEKTTTGGPAATSTTTKTTTQTISEKPGNETRTQQSSTTTTTKTTTTRTTGGENGGKTETKTVTKVEESSSGDAGASSIRKKYAKGRFKGH